MHREKVLYVINHAAFFVSHRLPLALGARERGREVLLLTGRAGSASMETTAELVLQEHSITHARVGFRPAGVNPFAELRGLLEVISFMRRARPDLVHCASPKGIVYGALAARITRVRAVVIAVSGMGYAFTKAERPSILRALTSHVYRILARLAFGHPNKRVIVQNTEDLAQVINARLASPEEVVLIPGSGVDLSRFEAVSMDAKQPIALFAARMIRDKGVMEFIEAARIVRRAYPNWRFVMAGVADYDNPSSVSAQELELFQAEGIIEWIGHVDDLAPWYAQASIMCLPSFYREGLPKVLLEAAAAGCAVVTTDLPGCREAIIPGVTGDLVPARAPEALAESLLALIADRSRRELYGAAGRRLAIERFDIRAVVNRVNDLYDRLLPTTH